MKKAAFSVLVMLGAMTASIGCNTKPAGSGQGSVSVPAHSHPTEGPHHGELVELGDEKYHAEFVHTEDTVTVYILDKSARNAVPINGTVTINAVRDGQPEQFTLEANPEATDNVNESSRFVLKDPKLVACLDDTSSAPKLVVTIDETPYRGEIHHNHSAHAHADHADDGAQAGDQK